MIKQKEFQKGRSMVEMLAVLMIIGVLTVGALAGFRQTTEKYKTGKMHNDILSISSETVNLYSWMRGFPAEGLSIAVLCNNEIFPDGCKKEGEKVKANNPFGGEYTVTPDVNQYLTITATNLPSTVCEDLTIREWVYLADVGGENPKCTGSGDKKTFSVVFE